MFRKVSYAFVLSSFLISAVAADTTALIIQTGPGGLAHKYAMDIEPVLSKILGTPIIVEFKPGAQGEVGAAALSADKKDKLTLMLGQLQPEFPIDQINDITPVLDIGTVPVLIIARTGLGINSLSELAAQPPTKTFTIGIVNGAAQLYWVREFVKNYKNVRLVEVPYRQGAAVLADVLGGHIDLGVASASGAAPSVEAGKVIGLTTLSIGRSNLIPTLKTPREQGIKFKNDTVGFAHLILWANPTANPAVVNNLRREYTAWAVTPAAQELFKNIDLRVNLKSLSTPAESIRINLGK